MVVRTGQMSAVLASMQDEYIERLTRHVESRYPGALAARGLAGPKLRAALTDAISDAREYGIQRAADLELYADCVALLGPNFDTDPACAWAGTILCRNDLCGKGKMDEISEELIFGDGGPR
jgi:hypothetical protein